MIDFQGLMNVAKANEPVELKNFNMQMFREVNTCGTKGCLIGNFCAEYPDDILQLKPSCDLHDRVLFNVVEAKDPWVSIGNRFNITPSEADWLFGYGSIYIKKHYTSKTPEGTVLRRVRHNIKVRALSKVTKEQALARLRKFIYYKLRKQELMEGDGFSERARYISGNRAVLDAQEAFV